MLKTFSKLGREGNIFNLIKNIYKIPAANSILNSEKMDNFPPIKLRTRQGYPLLQLLLNIVLEILTNVIR